MHCALQRLRSGEVVVRLSGGDPADMGGTLGDLLLWALALVAEHGAGARFRLDRADDASYEVERDAVPDEVAEWEGRRAALAGRVVEGSPNRAQGARQGASDGAPVSQAAGTAATPL